MLYQLVAAGRDAASRDPSDAVRTFVFMANFQAQEATGGQLAASMSAAEVISSLADAHGSARSLLFGLATTPPPALTAVGELGLPVLPAAPHSADPTEQLEWVGFIQALLPKEDDLGVLGLEIVPADPGDLPLPGEPADEGAAQTYRLLAQAADDIAARLGCDRQQLWLRQRDYSPASPLGSEAQLLTAAGFRLAHAETQGVVPVAVPVADHRPGAAGLATYWSRNYALPDRLIPGVCRLLEAADRDLTQGRLTSRPAPWTPERLARVREHLDQEGSTTWVMLALDEAGVPFALAEASQGPAHSSGGSGGGGAIEQGITVIAAERRTAAMGARVVSALLAGMTAPGRFAGADEIYTAVDVRYHTMRGILDRHGFEPLCTVLALERETR